MSLAKSRMPTQASGRRLSAIALGMAMTLPGTTAAADPAGRLIFLGWTADQQHSVWLSAISPGQFEVESAKQSQIYDSWRQDHKGLHLTVSPEAQNGGTHKLYAYVDSSGKRVLLDTDNQQSGHFTFPDHFTPPNLPSRPTSPPQGLMPTRPPLGGINRPGGVQPPIGTLPPQGMMPTRPPLGGINRPGGVQPPIGTLPPQGLMPTRPPLGGINRPGGVQPPIGTLPPQGMMPTRPPLGGITRPGGVQPPIGTLPPQGMMPTLPGGVQPPIGTLPPQGVMPTLPGGVQPPIGTLPPQGVMPTLPGGVQPPIGTLPPQGVMPTLPGGVQPPIGTLPPQGVMPTLPGGVQPPIGTLPPQGVMPTLPGGVQPPIGTLPPEGLMPTRPPLGERPFIPLPAPVTLPGRMTAGQQASERALNERTLCVMADERDQLTPEQRDQYPACPFTRAELAAGQVASQSQPVPLPEGRRWNLWADEVYYDISDHREGLDMSGSTNVFSLGADTRLDNDLILGLSVARVDSKVDSFNGGMRLSAGGYNIGPYLAYPVSASWMLDGSLVYGWMDNNQDLLFLSGDYGSTSVGGSLGATGQYFWEETSVRPRLAINYSHNRSDGYRMEGDYQGLALRLDQDSDSYNQGNMTGTVEFSRVYYTSKGLPLMPYGELGLDYGFERPNDGYILTGDLSSARTEPLSGTVRLGMRTLIGGEATLTTSAGYTSIGQDGLNIWEWRINLSKPF
ncbi:autotransporter outer membrane beta-barrel domain-containing protein [Aeromonas sp. sia0103]|uniref:autotransporter outer membrane beta-barrel domain-containing protein n=1 Tax=Aeromonas sp. sia0103 TaxID=2854782 RepID=UPI00210A4983|nr:autotransporter domain-containing protein [Aeromonas sp. sia0103]